MVLALTALVAAPAIAQERPTFAEALSADADGRFSTLLTAIEAAGLLETVNGLEGVTLLAPTNDAFQALFDYLGATPEDVLADTETLTRVLTYHVLPGEYFLRNLTSGPTLDTVEGGTATFNLTDGVFTVNGVNIADVDNVTSQGVFHAIDGVILPADIQEAAQANRAHIRVAHLSPDAGAVDVWLGGEPTDLTGVPFGTVSDWIEIPSGSLRVGLAGSGSEPRGNTFGNIQPGSWVTIAAIGQASTDDLKVRFIAEDHSELAADQARVVVLHAIQNAGAVDVLADGGKLIGNLNYPGAAGDNDGVDTRLVPAGSYQIQVVPAGATEPVVINVPVLALDGNTVYLIAAAGTLASPQVVAASTSLSGE
jgi:uncharacterized surface protein with fasciclin (FAS1) repeats